jgi:hypothetical protein
MYLKLIKKYINNIRPIDLNDSELKILYVIINNIKKKCSKYENVKETYDNLKNKLLKINVKLENLINYLNTTEDLILYKKKIKLMKEKIIVYNKLNELLECIELSDDDIKYMDDENNKLNNQINKIFDRNVSLYENHFFAIDELEKIYNDIMKK